MHYFNKLAVTVALLTSPMNSNAVSAQSVSRSAPILTTRNIVIGDSITVQSTVWSEPREINIYLPNDYTNTEESYPVLYVIDGGLEQDFLHVAGAVQLGALWGRSRSAIVVGIATSDRRRELTGPTRSVELLTQYPTAGSSSRFRDFIREEVMPLVNARYRSSGETAVIGESLAGLFIVETWLREPTLFGSYAAISPSLWWDDGRLASEAQGLLTDRTALPALYLAMADEGPSTAERIEQLLDDLGRRTGWCYSPQPSLTHATIYHSVSPEALQFLFAPEADPDPKSGFVVRCAAGTAAK